MYFHSNDQTKHPGAKLSVGNTEIGIETKFKNLNYPVRIQTSHVRELNVLTADIENLILTVGASVPLVRLETFLKDLVAENSLEHDVCCAILEQLKLFAGHQIRNVASLAGNIATASPISVHGILPLNPALVYPYITFINNFNIFY